MSEGSQVVHWKRLVPWLALSASLVASILTIAWGPDWAGQLAFAGLILLLILLFLMGAMLLLLRSRNRHFRSVYELRRRGVGAWLCSMSINGTHTWEGKVTAITRRGDMIEFCRFEHADLVMVRAYPISQVQVRVCPQVWIARAASTEGIEIDLPGNPPAQLGLLRDIPTNRPWTLRGPKRGYLSGDELAKQALQLTASGIPRAI